MQQSAGRYGFTLSAWSLRDPLRQSGSSTVQLAALLAGFITSKNRTTMSKKIGLIGGLGPEATVDYYNSLIDIFKEENQGNLDYPEILIYSVNLGYLISNMKKKDYETARRYISEKIAALERAGAGMVALTANTPHLFFDSLRQEAGVPMISIVEAAAKEAQRLGIRRAGLLGTRFTMEERFFHDVFRKSGIEVVSPGADDIEIIHHKLFTEIELGIFKDETRQQLIGIIAKMKADSHIDGIILGCTEFPLILPDSHYAGIPALNTTRIHVNEIVKWYKS